MTKLFSSKASSYLSLSAMVRAYVPALDKPAHVRTGNRKPPPASEWALVFDTETTVDAAQALRVGSYQLRQQGDLIEQGLFYEVGMLTQPEIQCLAKFAAAGRLKLMKRETFIEEVLFAKAYELRATIIGFNLPFDVSRIARRHNSARGKTFGDGGFTFQLSANPKRAHVQIKHLNSRAALIQFAQEAKQRTPRGERRRKLRVGIRRGIFVDVKTLASALLSKSHSLASLSAALLTTTRKEASEEHGGRLSARYLDYLLTDVQATWECYLALKEKFDEHGLAHVTLNQVLSEASIGKAYLKQMAVKPFREMQPDFPNDLLGIIASTYYGGRTETRWRCTIEQVLYCDFLSMYPTVCTLMGLWRFIAASGVDWSDTTDETKTFLDDLQLNDLKSRHTWSRLHTIVQLKPQKDILPLRARYDGVSPTIGVNQVTSDNQPLWYTLADVMASKLLAKKTPQIIRSITFRPRAAQPNLQSISIGGAIVDPLRDDPFKRFIDIRNEVKSQLKHATGAKREELDSAQQALKIVANATSYGIFVEVNVSKLDRREERPCFGPDGSGFPVETEKNEDPGPFFHPLIATLITGAARLMLATAETLTLDKGLDWAFCDTDSLAIAKPDGMSSDIFIPKANEVVRWFDDLNPYEAGGSLFKIEDQNFALSKEHDERKLEPLFCLCLSSKRYALFNVDDAGRPVIRKVSAHGLGQLMAPYPPEDAPGSIPAPTFSLSKMGVARWQYDFWYQIIRATIDGHPKEVDLNYHPALKAAAMICYAGTSPSVLRWFKGYNKGREYRDQVRPFGFLNSLQTDFLADLNDEQEPSQKRRRALRPISPFNRDPAKSANEAFDRETGAQIPKSALKSYAAVLAKFPLSPEPKFENGQPFDIGRTERRRVHVSGVIHIGKEANK